MGDAKKGCRVRLVLEVYDDNDQLISDIPSGNWYGSSREQANDIARDLTHAVADRTAEWDKKRAAGKSQPNR